MSFSNYVHMENCEILKVTDSAIKVYWRDDEYWIPKSQISNPEVFEEGDKEVTVSITEWIANEKGIDSDSI